MKYFILLLIIGLCITSVSATVNNIWIDDFDSNTSSHYKGTSPLANYWTWKSNASLLFNTRVDPARVYYTDKMISGGNYSYNWTIGILSDHTYPHFYFGSAAAPTGISDNLCDDDGTVYFAWIHFGTGYFRLYKNVAGAQTLLGSTLPGWAYVEDTSANFTVTVNWTPDDDGITAILSKTTSASTYTISVTDGAIDTGYFGVGEGFWVGEINWHKIGVWNETTPTPTPTPTPTTYPIIPTEQPGTGLYIGGDALPVGIISGIFLTLDQQPFLLAAIVILIAGLVLRRR